MNLVDYNLNNYGGSFIFASSNGAPLTRNSNNSTDNTSIALATVTIPGGFLGIGDHLEIYSWWTYTPYTTNSIGKSLAPKISAGSLPITTISSGSTVSATLTPIIHIVDATTAKGQNTTALGSSTANTPITRTIDITADIDITFECFWASNVASESIVLESYYVKINRRPR